MYKKIIAVFSIILSMIVMTACQQNKNTDSDDLPVTMDDSSRVIIDRAIAYAGGYDAWQQKKTLSFDKKSIYYDSTGKVTRESDMHLDYMTKPEFKAKLTYNQHDTIITLINDGKKAAKLYNGKASAEQKDIDAAWNIVYSSHYNMSIPFKLKDPGTKADYLGMKTLSDGVSAQEIKIVYNKGEDKIHDIWYYYFEPGTAKILASSQEGANNIWNYTTYNTFEKAGGLLMPGVRKAYKSNVMNKPEKLVVESKTNNLVFDKEFAADHFKIKGDK